MGGGADLRDPAQGLQRSDGRLESRRGRGQGFIDRSLQAADAFAFASRTSISDDHAPDRRQGYRLGVFPVRLPPLRERREDIPLLVWAMIERLQPRLGRHITRVPGTVMDRLVNYAWPGNVRELENVVERALILSPGPVLQVEVTLDVATSRRADRLAEVEREHILHGPDRSPPGSSPSDGIPPAARASARPAGRALLRYGSQAQEPEVRSRARSPGCWGAMPRERMTSMSQLRIVRLVGDPERRLAAEPHRK
jgi:hypothetical protein